MQTCRNLYCNFSGTCCKLVSAGKFDRDANQKGKGRKKQIKCEYSEMSPYSLWFWAIFAAMTVAISQPRRVLL